MSLFRSSSFTGPQKQRMGIENTAIIVLTVVLVILTVLAVIGIIWLLKKEKPEEYPEVIWEEPEEVNEGEGDLEDYHTYNE